MTKKRTWSPEARQAASERMRIRKEPEMPEDSINIVEGSTGLKEFNMELEVKEEQEVKTVEPERYLAKREFDYIDDVRFELGEIVNLRGAPNDTKLISLSYVIKWEGKPDWEKNCIQCGKTFGHDAGYTKHCAQHYEMCSLCKKLIDPSRMRDHSAAHAELGVA